MEMFQIHTLYGRIIRRYYERGGIKMNELLSFVIYLCISFVIFSVVSIIRIKTKKIKIYANNKLEPYDFKSVPGLNYNKLENFSEKFIEHGFKVMGDFKFSDLNEGQTSYSRRFVHKSLGTLASIGYDINSYHMEYDNKNGCYTIKYDFTVSTRFTDDTGLTSTSISEPKIFEDDRIVMIKNQDINDLDNIIKKHIITVSAIMEIKTVDYSAITTEPEKLAYDIFVKRLNNQVQRGVLEYNSINSCYLFTWDAATKFYFKEVAFKFRRKKELKS